MNLIKTIKPSDIATDDHFFSSIWQNCEKECIARNIVVIAKKKDKWQPFTFNQYKTGCSHVASDSDRWILEDFVKFGYLTKKTNRHSYNVNNKFIKAIFQYAKED